MTTSVNTTTQKGDGKTTLVDVLSVECAAARRKLVEFIRETEVSYKRLCSSSGKRMAPKVRAEYLDLRKRMHDLLVHARQELEQFDLTLERKAQ